MEDRGRPRSLGVIVRAMHARPRLDIMAARGTFMQRRVGVRKPPGPPGILEPARPVRRRSMAAHHRRRRAVVILVLAALGTLGAVLLTGAGARPAERTVGLPGHGFLGRIRALAGSGAGSLTAREGPAENAAINRTLAYTPYVRVAGAQHREIALTFDDGPGPYTPQILSILERHEVPATFFEVGVLERYFYASTAAIVADGDAIGDHTEVHAPMSRLSPVAQRAQLLEEAAAIERHGARFPRLFRPPYGMWNAATLGQLRRYHMLMVLWTVDTNDYRRPGVRAIVSAALSGARPGAIILLHDAGGNRSETVAALPQIIAALRRRHFRFVTVPRLLLDNPPPRAQKISAVIGTGA
ncbi:MAG: polysaccharide deacetylase family protein [Solirubrobacterales bacterium]|nr:polysaccharide deacetylase family protein [Solirubrobacterales bacterium]